VASGGVLVHCYGGRSRSAAFVCAFLMSSHGWPYEQAQGISLFVIYYILFSLRLMNTLNLGDRYDIRGSTRRLY
jgi:hypothetical protein